MMRTADVEIERNILKCILQNKDFARAVFTANLVIDGHFTDLFHMDAFKTVKSFYNKYGTPPDSNKMKIVILPNITYTKKFKTKDAQRNIWLSAIDRLFQPISKDNLSDRTNDVDMLETMRKARVMQTFLIKGQEMFEDGKLKEFTAEIGEVLKSYKVVDNQMTEGNIVEDFPQHIQYMEQQRLGLIRPVRTGINGVMPINFEKESEGYKVADLDTCLDGGLYPGEFHMLIGSNNTGKSFSLMECSVGAAMHDKANTILFTIEMNKMKQQRRIYSRITGIPYSKFRKGMLSAAELKLIKNKLEWWQSECGILHVVGFDKGATSADIDSKIQDAENRYGVEFELISIDYINDMQPIGKFQSAKGWDAQGEISWDLAQMAKRMNNHKGAAFISAGQKKTTASEKKMTDWQDAAFSPLPSQHASVNIGLTAFMAGPVVDTIRWDIPKNRDANKGMWFYTYPDFSISRIWSQRRIDARHMDIINKGEIEE